MDATRFDPKCRSNLQTVNYTCAVLRVLCTRDRRALAPRFQLKVNYRIKFFLKAKFLYN